MRQRWRTTIGVVVLLGMIVLLVPRGLVGDGPALAAAPLPPSDCEITVTHRLASPVALAGETVSVSMRIEPYCPMRESYRHVVFVLPASEEISAGDRRAIRDDVYELVDDILDGDGRDCCGERSHARVGIVTYNSRATEVCELMNDVVRLRRCADRVMNEAPGQDLGQGMRSAGRVLQRGRDDKDPEEIMVLVAGTDQIDECRLFERAANALKSQGILIVAACAGNACDAACLRELASSARYFYARLDPIRLIFERISCECLNISLRQLQWSEALPQGFDYVEGSASIASEPRGMGEPLAWAQNFVPKQGLTLTYDARPSWLGFRALELGSRLEFRDVVNRAGGVAVSSTLGLSVLSPVRVDP